MCAVVKPIYNVSQKKLPPPYDFCQFLPNGWEYLIEILHTYYAFKYTIDCQILSNYLKILQSYAALKRNYPPNFIISKYNHREFYYLTIKNWLQHIVCHSKQFVS